MKTYMVLLDESSNIQFCANELISACNTHSNIQCSIYQSFNFIDGTGFMKTVRDEIDFVLSSYRQIGLLPPTLEEFVINWQLHNYLEFDIAHLSGGWKKFLGLALFTIQNTEGKIFFDACRQLSYRLIKILFNNIANSPGIATYFFEYDASLAEDFCTQKLYLQNGLQLTENLPDMYTIKSFETNYIPTYHEFIQNQ